VPLRLTGPVRLATALGYDAFDARCAVIDPPLLGDSRITRHGHEHEAVRQLAAEEVFEAGPALKVRPSPQVFASDFKEVEHDV